MPKNTYLCPRCGKRRSSPMDACSFCDWRPVLAPKEERGGISRRVMLALLGGAGALALGGGVGIWLTRKKPHPPLLTYTGHHGVQVTALTWSPDGNFIASGDSHGNILVWDTASGETALTCRKSGTGGVSSVSWSPDGASLLAGYTNMLAIWDAHSGASTFATTRLTGPAAYSPHGDYKPCYFLYPLLIAACQDQRLVQVFPSTSLTTPIASITTGPVSEIAFNPDEESHDLAVVTTAPARKLVLYSAIDVNYCATSATSDKVNTHLSYKAADPQFYADSSTGALDANWGPGGSYLIGGTPPAAVEISWDYGKYTMQHPAEVVAAALCTADQNLPAGAQPDGEYCVIGYIATADREGVVRIWGNDQKYLAVMQTQQQIQTLAWSPDGNFLAIVTIDGVVRVWQANLSSLPVIWTESC